MKNDIEILKVFTRKLANCKYSVPAEKLTQYLKEGSFGYSFDPNGDNLITNDSVFADEVATAVEHIRSIFNDPHITLKQEEVIRNVSVASEFDTRALSDTMKDEKLWRVKLNKAMPEFVHTYVREDNLAIFPQWREYEFILENFRIFVYPRHLSASETSGLSGEAGLSSVSETVCQAKPVKEICFLSEAPLFDISSSAIRREQGRQ